MSRNGNGVYTLPSNSWNPAVSNTDIDPTDWNATATDLATAITDSIATDGQTTCTGSIPFAQGINVSNGGLKSYDAGGTYSLAIKTGSTFSANRILTINPGNANRTLSITSSATISQDYSATGSPQFGKIGIGMSPVNILDITQNQNGMSLIGMHNNSSEVSARAGLELDNGTNQGYLVCNGTSFTASGIDRTDGAKLQWGGAGGLTLNTNVAQPIYFAINSSEKARIGTDGSLLVGTTTNGGWIGNSYLESKSPSGPAVSVWNSASTNLASTALITRVENTGNSLIAFNYQGTSVGSVTTNGTSTVYNTSSDARLKNWVSDTLDYRTAIRALRVGSFDMYGDFGKSGAPSRGFGVFAQQAYEVLGGIGVTKPVNEDDRWQVSAEPFAFVALWGVKDLYNLNDNHEDRIAALEAERDDLRTRITALETALLKGG